MSYKTGYPLSLDFFHFVNKGEALDSTFYLEDRIDFLLSNQG